MWRSQSDLYGRESLDVLVPWNPKSVYIIFAFASSWHSAKNILECFIRPPPSARSENVRIPLFLSSRVNVEEWIPLFEVLGVAFILKII